VRVFPHHAIVLLEDGAVSFCHYENPRCHAAAPPQWMAEALLSALLKRAQREEISLTFLMGKTPPPPRLEKPIQGHAKIVPAALAARYPEAILVLDGEDGPFPTLKASSERIVILRLARHDLPRCTALFEALTGKFRRLSLHLTGIEYYGEAELALYAGELEKMARRLALLCRAGSPVEVNVLTDRMMLSQMRNCGAGTEHLTVAPDGRLYLCPGFLADGAAPVGRFDAEQGFVAGPVPRADLKSAPICSRCDAFHCKRCLYLNERMTLERNIPSEQQCALAHIEREASRQLLNELGTLEPFRRMARIPELTYRDPLECIDLPPRASDPATDAML